MKNKEIFVFGISHPNFKHLYRYLTEHLSRRTGFSWEIVGVDGHALAKQQSFASMGHNQALSNGQIGCSLAHCLAYQRMSDLGLRFATIIEDDVRLPTNFDDSVAAIATKIRPGEVISLHNPMMEQNPFSALDAEAIIDMKLLYPMSPRSIRSESAYVISTEAALKI